MKYFVHYVEDSKPKLKVFKTKRSLSLFLNTAEKQTDLKNGFWVDFVFRGKILSADSYYCDVLDGYESQRTKSTIL